MFKSLFDGILSMFLVHDPKHAVADVVIYTNLVGEKFSGVVQNVRFTTPRGHARREWCFDVQLIKFDERGVVIHGDVIDLIPEFRLAPAKH